jgi:hypothetical protein
LPRELSIPNVDANVYLENDENDVYYENDDVRDA